MPTDTSLMQRAVCPDKKIRVLRRAITAKCDW